LWMDKKRVGCEAATVTVMMSSIFCDIMLCSLLKVNHWLPASCWFLACLILRPWRWGRHVPLKHWLTFKGLHGITYISQQTELFQIRWEFIKFYEWVLHQDNTLAHNAVSVRQFLM
jgi:hypothetical protein